MPVSSLSGARNSARGDETGLGEHWSRALLTNGKVLAAVR